MGQNQLQFLSYLAVSLRVLKTAEKNKWLYELGKYAEKYRLNEQYHQFQDPHLASRIANSMYYSLEGVPYAPPEFVSQATMKDVKAHEKFDALFKGVVAYREASLIQREAFKKSVLVHSNPLKKIMYWVKMCRNRSV